MSTARQPAVKRKAFIGRAEFVRDWWPEFEDRERLIRFLEAYEHQVRKRIAKNLDNRATDLRGSNRHDPYFDQMLDAAEKIGKGTM